MWIRIRVTSFVLILLLIALSGCADRRADPEAAKTGLKVVTTIFPLADLVTELGGDSVAVSYLLPAGASPHAYEPTVDQARKLNEADLFIYIGAGLDQWAVPLAQSAGSELVILDLSAKVSLLDTEERQIDDSQNSADHEHDGHSDCADHDHGPADPHYWLDPLLVRDSLLPAIYEQLLLLDPAGDQSYQENYDRYCQNLTDLDEQIRASVERFASTGFVAFHSAWQYFARRYQLQEIAVIAEFPGQEPSAGWVSALIDLIRENQVSAIFAEPQFSPALAEQIAAESGIEVIMLDPLGGESLSGRDSYINLLNYNLEQFQKAMGE